MYDTVCYINSLFDAILFKLHAEISKDYITFKTRGYTYNAIKPSAQLSFFKRSITGKSICFNDVFVSKQLAVKHLYFFYSTYSVMYYANNLVPKLESNVLVKNIILSKQVNKIIFSGVSASLLPHRVTSKSYLNFINAYDLNFAISGYSSGLSNISINTESALLKSLQSTYADLRLSGDTMFINKGY
jgi:hypothetical protein